MITEQLNKLFIRDLKRLKIEIGGYQPESRMWKTEKHILNSAGNLCLHICGNLNHFIGSILGNTGYVRDRDAEFNDKNVSNEELQKMIDSTIEIIEEIIPNLSGEQLKKVDPEKFNQWEIELQEFLISLFGHLNYHLGQINYHRRLVD